MSDNIIDMSVKTDFVEKVNLNKAIYMNKLKDNTLYKIFCENIDTEINKFTHKKYTAQDIRICVSSIRKYCRLAIAMKGRINQQYKFSTEDQTGRMWVKGTGHQNLRWTVREFLSGEYYWDIDIKNAAPNIIRYLKNKNKLTFPTPYLDMYCDDRDETLKKYNTDKLTVLIQALNGKKKLSFYNEFIKGLYDDVMKIKKSVFPEFINDKNKLCTQWCKLVYKIENEIIQKALIIMGHKNIGAVIFDGFHLDKSIDYMKALDTLNNHEALKEYNIRFARKPFEFHHEMDLSHFLGSVADGDSYEIKKQEFEQSFCKINVPLLYIEEYLCPINNTQKFYLHDNLQKRVEDVYYKEEEKGELVDKKFFPTWAADPDKRKYQTIDFLPYNGTEEENPIHPEVFNTFKGFKATKLDEDIPRENVSWFINHLELLCGIHVEWMIKFIAHTIQKPAELPGVAIVMRGTEGAGKDAIIVAQERMIGEKHVHRTSDMNECFGNFNGSLRENILYQFNEVGGTKGFENCNAIKDFITRDYHTINEKNIRPIKQKNCSRSYFFSNGFLIINIQTGDRRFVVFKTGEPKPKEYYTELFGNIYDDEKINELYTFFSNYNITGFVPHKDRPITENHEIMQDVGIHPFINFFYEEKPYESHTLNGIYEDFVEYCKANHIPQDKYSKRDITKILYDLPGVERKRSGKCRYVNITKDTHDHIHKKFFKHLQFNGMIPDEKDSGVQDTQFIMDEDSQGLDD